MAEAADLHKAAAAVSADLEALGIRHAVSGSIALAAHGYVRGTLRSILPDRDARLAEWEATVARFSRGASPLAKGSE